MSQRVQSGRILNKTVKTIINLSFFFTVAKLGVNRVGLTTASLITSFLIVFPLCKGTNVRRQNPGPNHHSTFDALLPVLRVFLEAESVLVAELEVFPLVFVAAGLPPEVVSVVAGLSPEVVFAAAAEPSPEVVALVSEPGVVFVAFVFVVDVAEPQASVGIAVAFVVLVPVSVVVVEIDSSGRPKFFSLPNIYSFPKCSSSVEVVG